MTYIEIWYQVDEMLSQNYTAQPTSKGNIFTLWNIFLKGSTLVEPDVCNK